MDTAMVQAQCHSSHYRPSVGRGCLALQLGCSCDLKVGGALPASLTRALDSSKLQRLPDRGCQAGGALQGLSLLQYL